MNRRAFIGTLAGGVLTAPLAAEGQQGTRVPRVGYLSPLTASVDASRSEAFRRGLRELGYIEGRNIMVEYRFADGHLDRLPALAGELVGLNVDVIIAAG